MWNKGIYEGYKYQAKVYPVGSQFGIDGGRVSKLTIWDGGYSDFSKAIYNYDRGLDFDNAPAGLVDQILALYPVTQ